MRRLKDGQLYTDNTYAVNKLAKGFDLKLERLGSNILQDNTYITYHCYWFGDIGRKQVFSIKSFLCTQDQQKCKLILWLDAKNGFAHCLDNPLIQSIIHLIEVRKYDPVTEIIETPWDNCSRSVDMSWNLPQRSDGFRYIILYKYGGLYFDLDVLFLRDLAGLLEHEFCYACEGQSYANSAILNLQKSSTLSKYLLEKSISKGTVLPWMIFNYEDPLLAEILLLPCAFLIRFG